MLGRNQWGYVVILARPPPLFKSQCAAAVAFGSWKHKKQTSTERSLQRTKRS